MSFAEILDEIPKLSFSERQELVRIAIAVDENELTAEENAILDERMEDFRRNPEAGISPDELKEQIRERIRRR
jgi:putative addiction module component (TIGR02574 family)